MATKVAWSERRNSKNPKYSHAFEEYWKNRKNNPLRICTNTEAFKQVAYQAWCAAMSECSRSITHVMLLRKDNV